MTISSRRSQLIWCPVVGWVLLSCVPAAHAQMTVGTTSAVDDALPRRSRGPPTSRPSPPSYSSTIVGAPFGTTVPVTAPDPTVTGGVARTDDQELGVRLGGFYLYPQIEMNGGYDSNVFAQSASLGHGRIALHDDRADL